VTFKLTDSDTDPGNVAAHLTATSQALTLTIYPAPAIVFTNASLPAGTYNVSYSASAAATGGAGTLTYSKTGTWPTGLNLNTSSGAITGIPTAAASFAAGVKVADAFGDTATQSYTIVVIRFPLSHRRCYCYQVYCSPKEQRVERACGLGFYLDRCCYHTSMNSGR